MPSKCFTIKDWKNGTRVVVEDDHLITEMRLPAEPKVTERYQVYRVIVETLPIGRIKRRLRIWGAYHA